MKLVIVVGTRPEILKMAPVILELKNREIPFDLIQTGQHYDYYLAKKFIEELNLPPPRASFQLLAENTAAQLGEMMVKLEGSLSEAKERMLLIQGDTNSMLAAALTGLKLGMRIAHIEAGLRSHDWRMPEEHNRRMVDHVSNFLFAPTETARINLINEAVYGTVYVTGNTVIDAIRLFSKTAEKESHIMSEIKFNEFALATIHRAENVDDPTVLRKILLALEQSPLPIVFPIHPRTMKRFQENNLYTELEATKTIQVLPPQGYFDFLMIMKKCRLILTDSGGIQEEATSPLIRKPVLVLRQSTERPEAVEDGFAKLVNLDSQSIVEAIRETVNHPPRLPQISPYGDGTASKRIINVLEET